LADSLFVDQTVTQGNNWQLKIYTYSLFNTRQPLQWLILGYKCNNLKLICLHFVTFLKLYDSKM